MINSFTHWANNMPLSVAIQYTPWAIPALQTVHILAIGFVLAASLIINLRVLGIAARQQTLPDLIRRYAPWIWYGTAVLVVSGVVLGMAQAPDVIPNLIFQIKMALLAAAIAATYFAGQTRKAAGSAETYGHTAALADEMAMSAGARVLSIVSLLLWLAIAVAGRWIAYI